VKWNNNNNNNTINAKTRVIPAITGATGTISKSLPKHLSTIPGVNDVREV
jgi:hypothetical protein